VLDDKNKCASFWITNDLENGRKECILEIISAKYQNIDSFSSESTFNANLIQKNFTKQSSKLYLNETVSMRS